MAGVSYLQVVGTGTCHSSPGLLLFFDKDRYLFNVGESTQRFCMDSGIRMSKVNQIFFTQLSADAVGGLTG
eukprot:CAMPEP_0184359364 /NCGR_PEP_ID=MMETSP1089-20130417/119688_1 /TAXON_ID=38269 ORGANISM="Gloeochaete wittrockiana, Strain SAG46.84" /NCGR_SAMPLE_ID=MMETSP1089 /ASSEMBLY_ACC=CAM_ASM_000445 /LENGTH=70 /DNA_ID=CAMNT_0026698131 /DNA_START=26 /DNA_END=234 /DNA_ORIENTATION=+